MLKGQEMRGALPDSIGNLTYLKYLFVALTRGYTQDNALLFTMQFTCTGMCHQTN